MQETFKAMWADSFIRNWILVLLGIIALAALVPLSAKAAEVRLLQPITFPATVVSAPPNTTCFAETRHHRYCEVPGMTVVGLQLLPRDPAIIGSKENSKVASTVTTQLRGADGTCVQTRAQVWQMIATIANKNGNLVKNPEAVATGCAKVTFVRMYYRLKNGKLICIRYVVVEPVVAAPTAASRPAAAVSRTPPAGGAVPPTATVIPRNLVGQRPVATNWVGTFHPTETGVKPCSCGS